MNAAKLHWRAKTKQKTTKGDDAVDESPKDCTDMHTEKKHYSSLNVSFKIA